MRNALGESYVGDIQMIGRTYRVDQSSSISVFMYQNGESGREWWRTVGRLTDKGESFSNDVKHKTRTDAMRMVRMALHGTLQPVRNG